MKYFIDMESDMESEQRIDLNWSMSMNIIYW